MEIDKPPFEPNFPGKQKKKSSTKRWLSYTLFFLVTLGIAYLKRYTEKIGKVKIVKLASCKAISIKGKYCFLNPILSNLYKHINSQVIWTAGSAFITYRPDMHYSQPFNQPFSDSLIEVCIPISGDYENQGKFKVCKLTEKQMARVIFRGARENLYRARRKLYEWIEQHGYKITGDIREVYVSNPKEGYPADTVTAIYAPIA